MQLTVDADAKDLTTADADSETILVSGLSYFFYAVVADAVLTAADSVVAMTAVCGSSSNCSAVADLVETEAATTADVAATTPATKITPR